MKKVFALLLAEFRKLGANVIFANFSKIIIDTGKVDLASAHAYCDSLLKTLQTRAGTIALLAFLIIHGSV
jgi:DNA polymerase epsilon subunit 1